MESALYKEMDTIEQTHWWFLGRRAVVFEVLRRFAPGKKLLDVGLGTGQNAALFMKEGFEVTGLEPSGEAVALALQKAPGLKIIEDSFPSARVPEAFFDVIVLLDVIEHIEDDREALRGVYRALRPGGIALITTPAFPFLWSRHDELAHHYRRYRRAELKHTLKAAGFATPLLSYYNFFLFPGVALLRFMYKLLGIKKNESDFGSTPGFLNKPLGALFGFERVLLRFFALPFGVSLLAVARK